MDLMDFLKVIDYTVLTAYATQDQVADLLDDAHKFGTYSVCINPIHTPFAREYVREKSYPQKICTVIDFPLGSMTSDGRVAAIEKHAKYVDEVDVVVQIGMVKSHKYDEVRRDVLALVQAAKRNSVGIKFIVEDAYTTQDEKMEVYKIVCTSGADFIKTSTGFAQKEYSESLGNKAIGALPENVKLMAEVSASVGSDIGIKAAGGISTYEQALSLLKASGRRLSPDKFRLGMSKVKALYDELIKLR